MSITRDEVLVRDRHVGAVRLRVGRDALGVREVRPDLMSFSSLALARSITETVPSASFETSPFSPSRVIAAPYG